MYIIRHGATDNEASTTPILQGRVLNPGLSAVGCRQAVRLGRYLRQRAVTAVYSSPLLRCVDTARILSRRQEATISMRGQLIEADHGMWEGLTWDEVKTRYAAAAELFLRDPGTHGYLGGETLYDVQQRVVPFLIDTSRRHAGGRVVLVTHKQVIRAACAHLLALPLHRARELDPRPGNVSLVRGCANELTLEVMDCELSASTCRGAI